MPSANDDSQPGVIIGGVRIATLAELAGAVPTLLQPENLPVWCASVNHLTHGRRYRFIRDPDAYRARSEKRLRLSDFGVPDTSEIQAPRLEGGAVIFYVEDADIGIPYRVTAPPPDRPDGEAVYEPLPTTPVEVPPEPAAAPPEEEVAIAPKEEAPEPAAAAAEPEPEPAEEADAVEPLRDAVTAEDQAAVRQCLRTLGVDAAGCEPIFAAWDALTYRGTPVRQRLPTMQRLIAAIKALKAPPAVKEELWRLQKALIKYS